MDYILHKRVGMECHSAILPIGQRDSELRRSEASKPHDATYLTLGMCSKRDIVLPSSGSTHIASLLVVTHRAEHTQGTRKCCLLLRSSIRCPWYHTRAVLFALVLFVNFTGGDDSMDLSNDDDSPTLGTTFSPHHGPAAVPRASTHIITPLCPRLLSNVL